MTPIPRIKQHDSTPSPVAKATTAPRLPTREDASHRAAASVNETANQVESRIEEPLSPAVVQAGGLEAYERVLEVQKQIKSNGEFLMRRFLLLLAGIVFWSCPLFENSATTVVPAEKTGKDICIHDQ